MLGRFTGLKLKDARQKARDYTNAAERGINPNKKIQEPKAEMTFTELFEIYMKKWAMPRKDIIFYFLNNFCSKPNDSSF